VSAWLLITVVAATQVISQLISVAGVVWRERTRAASHCIQMETAASSGAVLYERLEDGTVVLITAKSAGPERAAAQWVRSGVLHDHSLTLRLVRAARDAEAREFWADLTPAEREAFKSAAREQTFPDGTVLMRQDEPADSIMVILGGRTTVVVDDDGRERIVARRGPGDMIGESGRAAGNVRTATVVAHGTVRALVITTEDYAVFVGEHFSVPDVVKRHVKGR
jgi:Cyclic nucleotide-binding domain